MSEESFPNRSARQKPKGRRRKDEDDETASVSPTPSPATSEPLSARPGTRMIELSPGIGDPIEQAAWQIENFVEDLKRAQRPRPLKEKHGKD
ncbi:MAG TPA: hypothetical protein VFS10_10835 [Pyrinomonadaceae bacterium]|nr:hypothetical protein [Pyrinomonadaceae bacterium]